MTDKEIGAGIGLIVAAAAAVLLFYAAILLIPLAAVVFIGWLIHYYVNKSPAAQENRAREHTYALYQEALARIHPKDPTDVAIDVIRALPVVPHDIGLAISLTVRELYKQEDLHHVPEPPLVCNSIEGGRYRDRISKLTALDTRRAEEILTESMAFFISHLPPMEEGTLAVRLAATPRMILHTIAPFYLDKTFSTLRHTLQANLTAQDNVSPMEYEGDNIQFSYLKDTPLLQLFDLTLPFTVPETRKWEHTAIVGGTGQGKTTLLQHLILEDLQSENSVVVVDSQGELIPKLSKLKLDKKVILIDPRDEPTLNVFDVGQTGEQVYNQTLDVFSYLFNSLLGADLTVRQATLFNYMIALMLTLPKTGRNATLLDIMRLMDDPTPYQEAINQLDPIPKEFFQNDFNQKTYAQTKEQIRYRLQAILGNKTLARLFLGESNPINFHDELNKGTAILIDTSKAYLGKTNSSYMGKIALTLILNAILSRTYDKHPTMAYVDEAAEYFDKSIDSFLTEARKKKAGLVLAHQYLAQTSQELRASIAANTSVKFAGGVSNQDARALAQDMRCTPEFIMEQKTLHFACYIRGSGSALSVHAPVGVLDDAEKLTEEEYHEFRDKNRALVSRAQKIEFEDEEEDLDSMPEPMDD